MYFSDALLNEVISEKKNRGRERNKDRNKEKRERERSCYLKSPNQEEPIERTKVEQTIRDNQKLRFKWQKQKKREIVRGSFNIGLFSGIQKLRVKRKWCTLVKVKRICYYLSWNLDGWLGRNQLLLVTKKCETMKTLVYKKQNIFGALVLKISF